MALRRHCKEGVLQAPDRAAKNLDDGHGPALVPGGPGPEEVPRPAALVREDLELSPGLQREQSQGRLAEAVDGGDVDLGRQRRQAGSMIFVVVQGLPVQLLLEL